MQNTERLYIVYHCLSFHISSSSIYRIASRLHACTMYGMLFRHGKKKQIKTYSDVRGFSFSVARNLYPLLA